MVYLLDLQIESMHNIKLFIDSMKNSGDKVGMLDEVSSISFYLSCGYQIGLFVLFFCVSFPHLFDKRARQIGEEMKAGYRSLKPFMPYVSFIFYFERITLGIMTLFRNDMNRWIHFSVILGVLFILAFLRLGAHASCLDFLAFFSQRSLVLVTYGLIVLSNEKIDPDKQYILAMAIICAALGLALLTALFFLIELGLLPLKLLKKKTQPAKLGASPKYIRANEESRNEGRKLAEEEYKTDDIVVMEDPGKQKRWVIDDNTAEVS